MSISKTLSPAQIKEFLKTLEDRFHKHMHRHEGLERVPIQAKLEAYPEKLWSLQEMETTGGEPDVVAYDTKTSEYIFFDCSPESPKGRRSLCYDGEARTSRKEHKPDSSAVEIATTMSITLLSEEQYRYLQTLGEFDTKTSSRIQTPASIRKLGGAIFADRRYNTVFVYHNGAESYYAARGFRGILKI